ncbi:hypothetical protein HDU97_004221 [Phlyctochytrium planicorne]|nr:hypothetical protein HDU97_004221 [Phlyctochytrium planicorne]
MHLEELKLGKPEDELTFHVGSKGFKECDILAELYISHIASKKTTSDEALRSFTYGLGRLYWLLRTIFRLSTENAEFTDRLLMDFNRNMIVATIAILDHVKTSGAEYDRRICRRLLGEVHFANTELKIGLQTLFGLPDTQAGSNNPSLEISHRKSMERCLELSDSAISIFMSAVSLLKELPGNALKILDRPDGDDGSATSSSFLDESLKVARDLSNAREKAIVNVENAGASFLATIKRFIDTSVELITRAKAVSVEIGLNRESKVTLQNVARSTRELAGAIFSEK